MTALLLYGGIAGSRLALLAFGFGLVYLTCGIFHFAHGAAYAGAAYACWFAMDRWGWSFWLAAMLGVGVATLVGWLVEVWFYRPLRDRDAPPDVMFLTSLGLYTAAVNMLALAFGHETQTLGLANRSFELVPAGEAALPLVVTATQLATLTVAVVSFAGLWWLFTRTDFGLAMRAMAANRELAEAVGLDPRRRLPQVVALASALGGLAAICVAADVGVSPSMGLEAVVTGAVAVVVGGVGSLPGTAVAGLLLGWLRHAATYASWIGTRWEEAVTFGLLLLILLVRPRGLFGRR